MKKASLLLLSFLTLTFSLPADAAYVMKKAAPAQAPTESPTTSTDKDGVSASSMPDGAAALEEFRNLPREERSERIQEAREEFRHFRKAHGAPSEGEISTLLLVIIAILLPPLAVGLHDRGLSTRFWIDLLLTLLLYVPGLIYALIVILKK